MTGDVLLQSRSRAWSRSRRVLRRIWKHQNCSALTWHCVSNHWRPVSRLCSCGTARTHNISSQRNAAEEIMAGKPRHLFLPTIFQSRPVRETPIVGAASSRDRGRSVSEGWVCGPSDVVMTLKSLLHRGVGSAVLTSMTLAQIASSCSLSDGRLVCGGMSRWRSRSSDMKSSQRLGPPS